MGIDVVTLALAKGYTDEKIRDAAFSDSDALEALAECGIITPAYQDGTFYTDANGAIYTL